MLTKQTAFAVACMVATVACASPIKPPKSAYIFGYLIIPVTGAGKGFNEGFSLYVPVWPLESYYPGRNFETGLPGTWMFAKYKKPAPTHMYSDAEGGLGWWTNTHFPQLEPKFEMGGVGPNFSEISSGPDAGAGSWKNPKGKYGVAQLSPWLLYPPDQINLKKGQHGEFFGYGYLNLPLLSAKQRTDGKNVPTGGNCWTLFINATNFKGPVAFFLPYFWSHFGLTQPNLVGELLDSRPMDPSMAIQMETHYIASAVAKDARGQMFARIAPTSFPMNTRGGSILVSQSTLYSKKALWDEVDSWFHGAHPKDLRFNPNGEFHRSFRKHGYSTWVIRTPQSSGKRIGIPIDFNQFAKPTNYTTNAYGYVWDPKFTTVGHGLVTIPQYYVLQTNSAGKQMWEPVKKSRVPNGLGLKKIVWKTPVEAARQPFTTPFETDPTWQLGKRAGPYKAFLGDGTVVTYYWYRFEDQPALQHADLTQAQRDHLQRKFELLERYWKKNHEFMAPPKMGKLASIDPALIVKPPKGFGIGYVPIAVDQRLVSH